MMLDMFAKSRNYLRNVMPADQKTPSPSRGWLGWGWVLCDNDKSLPHPPPNLPLEGGGNKSLKILFPEACCGVVHLLFANPLFFCHASKSGPVSVVSGSS